MRELRGELKFARWSGSGGLYGTRAQVKEIKRLASGKYGGQSVRVRFLDDRKLGLKPLASPGIYKNITGRSRSFPHTRAGAPGIQSDERCADRMSGVGEALTWRGGARPRRSGSRSRPLRPALGDSGGFHGGKRGRGSARNCRAVTSESRLRAAIVVHAAYGTRSGLRDLDYLRS